MPSQLFALAENGPERLEVAWRRGWRETTVLLDGEALGTIPTRRDLAEGRAFRLPDGSMLHVQLVKRFSYAELLVERGGMPLPGSSADPATQQRMAYGMVFFVAAINLFFGLLRTVFRFNILVSLDNGLYAIALGALTALMGWLVMRGSPVALIVAILVFAADGVLSLLSGITVHPIPSLAGLVARAFMLVPMVRGVPAMVRLRREA